MTSFINHIENWDEYITNRSYFATQIAGGSYLFASKIEFSGSDYKISNAVFREYMENSDEFHLKELACDNYKIRIKFNKKWFEERNAVVNPEYLESLKEQGFVIVE